jgi:hypothetical protein
VCASVESCPMADRADACRMPANTTQEPASAAAALAAQGQRRWSDAAAQMSATMITSTKHPSELTAAAAWLDRWREQLTFVSGNTGSYELY